MLIRETETGLTVITQPGHAWVAAQLAAHWGNETFARPEPWPDVILAIAIHDNGWTTWETLPERMPDTGRPRDFMHMPVFEHLHIWQQSIIQAKVQSRYAALLVSLHAITLAEWALAALEEDEEDRFLRRNFVDTQRNFQEQLREELARDPAWAAWVKPDRLETNLRLLKVCDELSLTICDGWKLPRRIENAPHTGLGDFTSLEVKRAADGDFVIQPYPFDTSPLILHVEERHLPSKTFPDDEALQDALMMAPTQTWTFTISQG
ncbi:MAG: DUF3891 family protein [Chloroflexi bacterium]|nr:DUF3891 family protein [Chloroflexota bacterium]